MSDVTVQSVLMNKKIGSSTKALSYVKKLGFKPIKKVHETVNYYRFRIKDPSKFRTFRIKKINSQIKLVIGIP